MQGNPPDFLQNPAACAKMGASLTESEMIPMSRIVYRKAVPQDSHALAVLKGRVWNTTYQGIYSDETLRNYDVGKNQQIFDSIIANPDIDLYVAVDQGEIVGFITCGKPFRPIDGYRQEVGLLYILQRCQRRGIGRVLFALAREHVRAAGEAVFVVAVNRRNSNAIAFYQAMGGQVISAEQHQLRMAFSAEG